METIGNLKEEFPDKYLFAEDLNKKTVTLTIGAINKDTLVTSKGKKSGIILTFVGKKKLLVLNKTNACLISEIFPVTASLREWVGKRITIYPTQCQLGGETVDCIRVWGSPELKADKEVMVKAGLKRVPMKLHAVKGTEPSTQAVSSALPPSGAAANGHVTASEPDPPVLEAWSALGWSREQGMKDQGEYQGTDYLAHLSALIDQENAKEGTF
jgi:hypothetical protein